jgi:homoserine kinase
MALARSRTPKALDLRVPASTSNVGPGFDAFGIALNLSLRVGWEPAEKLELVRKGGLAESVLSLGRDPVLRGLRRAAILAGGTTPTGRITVDANFRPGRGLGASGAGIVAGLVLGERLFGLKASREELLKEAIQLEGHPENATASMLGGAHWSAQEADKGWIHLPLVLHKDLRFLLVVPPYPLSTARAREVLPTSVGLPRAVAQASRTPVLLEGLRSLDPRLIRCGIRDELHVDPRLKQLTGAASMMEFADLAGAIATTLSGAGSALLVLTRRGQVQELEQRLKQRVRRLWGEAGEVQRAQLQTKGAAFA